MQSLLRQVLIHMSKAEACPHSRKVPHWRAETRRFRDDAAEPFAPSVRQRINLTKLHAQAMCATPETIDGQAPLPMPEVCPVTLIDLLRDDNQSASWARPHKGHKARMMAMMIP